jgi:chemotaxis receptor (MCP) glutamine deamidase CheD
MKNAFKPVRFRQAVSCSPIRENVVHVEVGKYVLAHKKHIRNVQTILGSCVGLIGYRDGHGFVVHVFSPIQASKMLQQLQIDVRREVGCALEDFHMTISGGNRVHPKNSLDVGKQNIEAVIGSLERRPDLKVHLGMDSGNVVKLSLDTGAVESRKL